MRTGQAVALYFSLFAATTAGILLYATAERDFRLPYGAPRDVASFTDRCFALRFGREFHRDIDPVQQLPTAVRLTAMVPADTYLHGWYLAESAAADTVSHSRQFGWGQALWRPAGQDSLDVRYLGWPLGMRLRIPIKGDSLRGRVLLNGDVGGDWPRLDQVVGIIVPCGPLSFTDHPRKVI